MVLSAKTYKKAISASILKQAEQLLKRGALRELDEERPGRFVAYVDDGDQSFDVMLQLNAKRELSPHSCDCSSEYFFCEHKATVFLHLLEHGSTLAVPKKKRVSKKELEAIALFEGVDFEALKQWVIAAMNQDKALRQQFELHFGKERDNPSAEQIQEKTRALRTAVMGRRFSASAAEIKKMIGLWEAYHLPILEGHFSAGEPSASGPLMWAIFSEVWDAHRTLSTNSNKISNYRDSLMKKLETLILQLSAKNQLMPHVESVLHFLAGRARNEETQVYMLPLLSRWGTVLPTEQATVLIGTVIDFTRNNKDLSAYNKTRVLHFIFEDCHKTEAIKPFLPDFPASDQNPEYNFRLIDLLLQEKNFGAAVQKCHAVSKFRFHQKFSLPLQDRWIIIYRETGDHVSLLNLLQTRLRKYFLWNDYELAMPLLKEDKDREDLLVEIRREALEQVSENYRAQEFLIHLAEEDKTLLHTLLQQDNLFRLYIEHFDIFSTMIKRPSLPDYCVSNTGSIGLMICRREIFYRRRLN